MGANTIRNLSKLSRPVDFSGLPSVGTCSPTDIDAPEVAFCIEVGRLKRYLIGDFKERGKQFRERDGQKILLARHVDVFIKDGYVAAAFLAWHEPSVAVIDAASTTIVLQYMGGEWIKPMAETLLVKYCRFFGLPNPEHGSSVTSREGLDAMANKAWEATS